MIDLNPPINPPSLGRDPLWTFDMVEDRLVEALATWWRMPDADDRYGIGGRISSIWSQYVPERALIDAKTEEPRRPLPSRGDIKRMQEATDWLLGLPEEQRKVVRIALIYLASGKQQVPWTKLWMRIGRGRPGPDGLRKRYSAGVTMIANALNA